MTDKKKQKFKKDWQGSGDGMKKLEIINGFYAWRYVCQQCGEKSITEGDELEEHKCIKKTKYKPETILKKAIEKAVANGYDFILIDKEVDGHSLWTLMTGGNDSGPQYPLIIFSHDFAKAFWGKEGISKYGYTQKEYDKHQTIDGSGWMEKQKAWKHHLQQMVLEKDPIKYLEKFL